MHTRLLATTACWLAFTALVSAQPINPGAAVELPTYTVPLEDATVDCDGGPENLRNPTFFFSIECLYWWTRESQLDRNIVGTLRNPAVDYTAFPGAGGTDDPNTVVLFGNRGIDQGWQWGLRGTAQFAVDDMNSVVVELSGLWLPRVEESATYLTGVDGIDALALLYNDVTNGLPGVQSAFPVGGLINGVDTPGGIAVEAASTLWGAEGNICFRITPRHSAFFAETMIGYRHLGLRETLAITAGQPFTGTGFEDEFRTTNFYNGFQVGCRLGAQWWHLSSQMVCKAGCGGNSQTLYVETTQYNGTGHLYDQISNFGRSSSSQFGFVSELGGNCTWSITPNLSVSCGYTWLYWSRVLRANNQVDSNINFNQVISDDPPLLNPIRRHQRSDFWAQGANCAIELIF